MVTRANIRKGFTLVEMMIVVAILGIMVSVAPNLFKQVRKFFFLNNVRVELQRDARTIMSLMTRCLRHAQSATISIDQVSGQPYYSRISFADVNGRFYSYYQIGKNLYMVDGGTKTLTTNLRYVAFAIPHSDDFGIISMSFTLEKSIYDGQTKAVHMASERVRVMN